jgi:hypothetical protein
MDQDHTMRRTIDELLVRYELEPTLMDLYVEGPTDHALFGWYVRRSRLEGVAVYSIDTIEVPSSEVRTRGLENNARGRTIALSSIFQDHFGAERPKIGCIVDADMNHFLGIPTSNDFLEYTDFTGLEMYLYDAKILSKFLDLYVRSSTVPSKEIFEAITPVLQELFLIRLCNEMLQLGLPYLSFERCCTVRGLKLSFDREDYITRYLSKGQALQERERFTECIEKHRGSLSEEPRKQINGHDFLALLSLFLRRHVNDSALVRPGLFERTLFSCVEIEDLDRHQLFRSLNTRFS